MIAATETFDGTWPFKARYSTRAGFAQHYVDEGPADSAGHGPQDGPLVLVHGEPTWGYLWRHLITPLARRYRVIVPDHMGFGKSADPADRSYLADEHIANLTSLLAGELDLRDITLVLHDWGGPIGAGFALRQPERIRRIVAVNTVLPLGLPGQAQAQAANLRDSAWFRWARQAAADGSLEEVLGNAGHTVVHLMLTLQTITRPRAITPAWLRAYSAHFTDRAACAGVIAFPRQLISPPGAVPAPAPDPAAVTALRAKPAMLAWGMRDTALLAGHLIPAFLAAYPAAPVVELARAGHFPQEDDPAALLAAIETFLQVT